MIQINCRDFYATTVDITVQDFVVTQSRSLQPEEGLQYNRAAGISRLHWTQRRRFHLAVSLVAMLLTSQSHAPIQLDRDEGAAMRTTKASTSELCLHRKLVCA